MNLALFLAELDELLAEAQLAFNLAANPAALEAARIEYLGAAKGRLKSVQKGLGGVAKEDKPAAGKRFNEVKTEIESAFESAQQRLDSSGPAKKAGPQFDPTLPGEPLRIGGCRCSMTRIWTVLVWLRKRSGCRFSPVPCPPSPVP